MELTTLLRAGYLSAASTVLLVSAVPPLRDRFLQYGARASEPGHTSIKKRSISVFSQLLDLIAHLSVPHSWFVSFYAVSVTCSLIWASALLSNGILLSDSHSITPALPHTMSFDQIMVAWVLMFIQGSRRLYECLTLSSASESKMWIGHWIIGILFYLTINVAIWIEGIDTLQVHTLTLHDFVFAAPSLRTFLAAIIFLLASGFQHDVHSYLAGLKRSGFSKGGKSVAAYQLPRHPAFNICLTPHYLAECLIYLALTIQAAPTGHMINWTLASALLFVAINLGVTANGTRAWYQAKFGANAVRGRSRMIPFVY